MKLYNYIENGIGYFFIYEYIDGINLCELLKSKSSLVDNEIKNIFFPIPNDIILPFKNNKV